MLQASPVQIDDDYLIAYIRRGGSFDPLPEGVLYRSESRDGGRTWGPGTETQFPNPNSAVDFIKLRNGHLLLVYNDTNVDDRMPLTVAISTDNDKTYPHRRDIVNKPGNRPACQVVSNPRRQDPRGVYVGRAAGGQPGRLRREPRSWGIANRPARRARLAVRFSKGLRFDPNMSFRYRIPRPWYASPSISVDRLAVYPLDRGDPPSIECT